MGKSTHAGSIKPNMACNSHVAGASGEVMDDKSLAAAQDRRVLTCLGPGAKFIISVQDSGAITIKHLLEKLLISYLRLRFGEKL